MNIMKALLLGALMLTVSNTAQAKQITDKDCTILRELALNLIETHVLNLRSMEGASKLILKISIEKIKRSDYSRDDLNDISSALNSTQVDMKKMKAGKVVLDKLCPL